ncbi:MAG TPA: hypothetical protein QF529_03390 [Candidatus Thalassarchaeaceae archaeon]|nr:hypothetical protein [Candidatus Thalassarchaeaceae archaeon]
METGTAGVDPNRTVLWAQVTEGQPKMSLDGDLRLRPDGISGNESVYLGDVARAALRSLGPADPPFFEDPPGYDEQKWIISSKSGDVSMIITSTSYWGFGLINRCFLNRIEMQGPLSLRARITLDIAASLGRNPWEPTLQRLFAKATGCNMNEHREAWQGLIEYARENMAEEIQTIEERVSQLKGKDEEIKGILNEASNSLDEARAALADHNAPAVERAIGRAIQALVEADPTTAIRSSELAASSVSDASWWNEIPKDDEVSALHLLEDEIPLVDMTEEE